MSIATFLFQDSVLLAEPACRSQQRNGRKRWTTVQGIPDRMLGKRVNFDKVLKALKKSFKTNGSRLLSRVKTQLVVNKCIVE